MQVFLDAFIRLFKRGERVKNSKGLLDRLVLSTDLADEPFPGQTIIEIVGACRVLVENHLGVKEYSTRQIGIRTNCGMALITGQCLELARMTREQIVVCGKIEGISLTGRQCP